MKKLILLLMAALVFGGLFATPLTEGFESLTCPADGWSIRYANPSPPSGNIMTHSTTYYLDDQRSFRFSSYSSATTYDQYLITPKLSVTANDQTVSFWYRKYDYGSEVFRVGWSLTGTELTDFTWSDDITNASTNWQQYTKTDLPIGTTYVAVHYKSNYQYYLYLDRFVGPEMAIDPEPSNHVTSFNTGTLGYTTIQLNWTGSTGAQLPAGYLIQGIKTGVGSYAAVTDNTPVPNDTDWSDGNAAINVPHAIGANSYTFMGLTPNTAYEFKIWPYTNSGANVDFKIDGSIPTVNASTRDATIYAVDLPHTENFDGVTAPNLPDGWLSLDNNGDGDKWETYNYNAHSAPNAVRIYTDYNTNNDDYLVTPRVQLTGNQRMRFWTRAQSTGEPDEISILLSSTTPEAANFTIVAMPSTPINFTTYTEYTVDLSDYTGFHYIAFTRKDAPADGWYLYVDDVTIENIPTTAVFNLSPDVPDYDFGNLLINDSATKTFRVSNTGIADLTFSSVTVSGTGFSPDPAFNYDPIPPNDYRDFTVKFTPPTAATYNGTLNFNFNRETRSVALSGTGIPYGISTATSTSDDDIGQIILGSFANPVTAPTPLTYNTTANQMYNDYTALGPINVQKTVDTPFSLTQINSGSYYTCHFKVFIDYNQNQVFDLPDELALTGSTSSSYGGSNPYNGSITIPLTALEGQTRMRVVLQETSNPDLVLPVGTYSWGETEDYTVNITAPPAVITPSNLTANNVTGNSAMLGWTENNTPPATQWDLVYGAPGFDPDSATPINVGINPHPLTGLSPSTTYQWYVRSNLGNNDTSGWGGPGLFTTTQIPATLPFAEDWESGQNGWTIVNGSQTNAWHIGTADPFGETGHSAYISNDAGTSNAYTVTSTSVSHIYRDIAFDNDCLNFPLSFMWKCNGEGTTYVYDYLQVHLVDTSVVPVAGTLLSSGTLGTYNQQTTWQQANITLPGSYSGTSKRLVFSWRNDTSIGNQPPANIDNIILTAVPAPTGPVEPPILIYPEIRQENLPITGFPYQFGWNTGGTEPETYILYIAALDDLSENFDMDEFFNVAESYDDNVTSPYTPDFTYAYEKWYVWTVSGSNTTYPDEVFEWPPYEFKIEQDPTVTEEDFPWCVDFENVPTQGFPLSGWTVHNLDGGGSTWNSTTSYNTTPSGSYAAIHPYGMNDEEGWMITPPIELPDNPCELKFWHYNYFPTWYEYSGVWVTIGDPDPVNGNWTELWNPVSVTDSWEQEIILLDDYANETIHLAFVYEGYNAHDWIIDDICVQLQPTELLAPILVLPADNAENMPKTGFSFTWEKDTMSVTPDSYTLYLSKNPATLLSDHIYTGIIGTSFDPTQAPSPVSFAYEEDWYWTIGAVKAGHNEEIATHRKFTIQIDPTILEEDLPWCDGFESYDDFAIFFSPWTNVDVDQSETYGMNGIDWLNEYQPQAFIIYNPSETTPALTSLDAYEGDKMAACFAAVMPADGGNGPNNDWLITPPIEGVNGLTASFWARSYTDEYGLERFRVGVSTSGTNPSNFTIISEGSYIEAPDEWTEYIFPLQYPGQIIHVGIQCISSDAFFLLVDKFCLYKEDSGLNAPEISIDLDEGYPTITWPAVAGATAYKVYGSADPYVADPWTLLTSPTTPDTGFTYTGTAAYHFFKVTAVAPDDKGLAAPARKPGPKLPTQKRTTAEIPQYKTRNK